MKELTSIEHRLRAWEEGKPPEGELQIRYDSIHPLWGGDQITISGEQIAERLKASPGDRSRSIVARRQVTREQLMELVRLLLAIRAWEQRMPDRAAVPDETTARLTITVGDEQSIISELCNDLKRNGRLALVRERMAEMVSGKTEAR